MKRIAPSVLIVVVLALAACGNDYPLYQPSGTTSAGTTSAGTTTGGSSTTTTTGGSGTTTTTGNQCGTGSSTIGYQANAAAVLNMYCVTGCHVANGTESTLPMDTYANAAISLTSANVFVVGNGMPVSGYPQLSTNQVCILQQWVAQNYPQ